MCYYKKILIFFTQLHQFAPFLTSIEAILKELDVKYDKKQERKQSNNQHHVKEGFKSFKLICFKDKKRKMQLQG